MPKSTLSLYLHIIAIAVIVFALGHFMTRDQGGAVAPIAAAQKESVYDRVMRTGVIRCAYMNWPPSISKDPNTGQFSGIMYDYMAALADAAGLKIEWTEELNLATYIQDLNNHKYDLECSGGWPNAKRGRELDYSTPIYYFPIMAVAREGDTRFDGNILLGDDTAVRIATIDGETSEIIRQRRFPNSTPVSLPSLSPPSDLFLQIAASKADITFNDLPSVRNYMQANPGVLKIVGSEPMRVIPNSISFAKGEYKLQQMINTATEELINDGVIDRILDKYEAGSSLFLRVANPYQTP